MRKTQSQLLERRKGGMLSFIVDTTRIPQMQVVMELKQDTIKVLSQFLGMKFLVVKL